MYPYTGINPYNGFKLMPAIFDGDRYSYSSTGPTWTVEDDDSATTADIYTGHLLDLGSGQPATNFRIQFYIHGAEGKAKQIEDDSKILVYEIPPYATTNHWIPWDQAAYTAHSGAPYMCLPVPEASAATYQTAKIVAVAGSAAPFVYSAREITLSTTGSWSTSTNGTYCNANLRNIKEAEGGGYPGSGKIPVGCTVVIWQENGGWWCDTLSYKGTYG